MDSDDPRSWDPYLRYRRKHPRFPGVKTCVDLLAHAKNDTLDGVLADLADHVASAGSAEVVAAFRAATDARVRALLLAIVAEHPTPDDLALLVDTLAGDESDLHVWAARGLHRLATSEAKRALWEARARIFADPVGAARFRQVLDDAKRGA